jgi:hypothetical protein
MMRSHDTSLSSNVQYALVQILANVIGPLICHFCCVAACTVVIIFLELGETPGASTPTTASFDSISSGQTRTSCVVGEYHDTGTFYQDVFCIAFRHDIHVQIFQSPRDTKSILKIHDQVDWYNTMIELRNVLNSRWLKYLYYAVIRPASENIASGINKCYCQGRAIPFQTMTC